MDVVCIGAGPASLYSAILLKKNWPDATIRLYEQNRADDTFGWGVVFSDEDVLEHNLVTGTWEIIYYGSAEPVDWAGAHLDAVALPEPDSLVLLVVGAAGLLALGRRRIKP